MRMPGSLCRQPQVCLHFYSRAFGIAVQARASPRLCKQVRLLAIIDMVLSMTHLFVSIWPAVMAVGMSYCGYAGAKL